MRRALWIIPALILITSGGAPAAHADTITYTPAFTCSSGCNTARPAPTAPGFTGFTSPALDVTFFNLLFPVQLSSQDTPTDTYSWNFAIQVLQTGDYQYFQITDLTNSLVSKGDIFYLTDSPFLAQGTLTFSAAPTSTPEPSSLALLFAGMAGLLLLSRKRIAEAR